MLWILLALLGIPIWLVLGGLGAALLSRRNFRSIPGTFSVRIRQVEAGRTAKWSGKGLARWAHDVLVVHKGLALVRTELYPVTAAGPAAHPSSADCRGLGDTPVTLTITVDDGTAYEVASSLDDAELLGLPFEIDPAVTTA